jgi:hypothetical protein
MLLCYGVGFISLLGLVVWVSTWRAKPEQRGFEVKQITGEPPVALRKDNDHG